MLIAIKHALRCGGVAATSDSPPSDEPGVEEDHAMDCNEAELTRSDLREGRS